jgi:hypothetical protein
MNYLMFCKKENKFNQNEKFFTNFFHLKKIRHGRTSKIVDVELKIMGVRFFAFLFGKICLGSRHHNFYIL